MNLRSVFAPRFSRFAALGALLALASVGALIGGGCGASSAPPSGQPGPLDRVSNSGSPFTALLPADREAALRLGIDADKVFLLGIRGDRAFYRLGAECYATGPAQPSDYSFGVVQCSAEFPSAAEPVMDFSVIHASGSSETAPGAGTPWRSEGVAADGVTKLELVSAEGQALAEAAVVDNTYRFSTLPSSAHSLMGYDSAGGVVFSKRSR